MGAVNLDLSSGSVCCVGVQPEISAPRAGEGLE